MGNIQNKDICTCDEKTGCKAGPWLGAYGATECSNPGLTEANCMAYAKDGKYKDLITAESCRGFINLESCKGFEKDICKGGYVSVTQYPQYLDVIPDKGFAVEPIPVGVNYYGDFANKDLCFSNAKAFKKDGAMYSGGKCYGFDKDVKLEDMKGAFIGRN